MTDTRCVFCEWWRNRELHSQTPFPRQNDRRVRIFAQNIE